MNDTHIDVTHNASFGNLYIVSTPIGNLQDITIRAIRTLSEVHLIACEDTRKTRIVLQSINSLSQKLFPDEKKENVTPRLISYYEQNEDARIPELVSYLKNGMHIALVSDAGTPLISDPGYRLMYECIKRGIKIVSIPGPSAVTCALTVSGLPTDQFMFLGYLPRKSVRRKKILSDLVLSLKHTKKIHPTVLFFESPHRIVETLSDMHSVFGDIEVVLARELTKVFEEVLRGTLLTLLDTYRTKTPKGEFVILFKVAKDG